MDQQTKRFLKKSKLKVIKNKLLGNSKIAEQLKKAIATPHDEHRVFESVKELEDALKMSYREK